jgi:hypothetical protein
MHALSGALQNREWGSGDHVMVETKGEGGCNSVHRNGEMVTENHFGLLAARVRVYQRTSFGGWGGS